MSQRLKTDWILFGTVLVMISFGMLILYSASSIMAQLDPRYGSSWHFVIRQVGVGGGGGRRHDDAEEDQLPQVQ